MLASFKRCSRIKGQPLFMGKAAHRYAFKRQRIAQGI